IICPAYLSAPFYVLFFFSSRRRHTRSLRDWSSDVCSSDLPAGEVWRLEEQLPGLIADCRQLLDADSRYLFLTVYAVRMSALAIGDRKRRRVGKECRSRWLQYD